MNRHQVLTGAVNSGDGCYSVGSVEGIQFTAYAAGCDIVILASDFQRVQIIPGATHGNIQIKCIDCSSDTGKIAASYDQQILIFEPTPLVQHNSKHKLDYRWYQTGSISCSFHINALSWNFEGTKLLAGGTAIEMWMCPDDDALAENQEGLSWGQDPRSKENDWKCIWKCVVGSNVYHLRFSPDGILFVSAGKSDRLVKVWYENKKSQMLRNELDSETLDDEILDYSFCFIAHPAPILDFSWRKISKYMPRGTVTNVLITWCRDNICRLWSETVLPDDGLVDLQQFDLKSQDPKLHTRHKNRFVHKISHIRSAMHKRRKHKKEGRFRGFDRVQSMAPKENHDYHKYWMQQNGLTPVLHFHLAANINPQTDIHPNPLGTLFEGHFVVHWLNNKELQFSVESELLMNELNNRTMMEDEHTELQRTESSSASLSGISEGKEKKHAKRPTNLWHRISSSHKLSEHAHDDQSESQTSIHTSQSTASFSGMDVAERSFKMDETFDRRIEKMLKDWHSTPDMLFAIHPGDGSFLVWSIEYLDEIEPGCFRQPQVTFNSRLPNVFPVGDAMSMSVNVWTYTTNTPLEMFTHSHQHGEEHDNNISTYENTLPQIFLLTKHLNGSLNLWKGSFSDKCKYRTLLCVTHSSRVCGHRFRTNSASSHPVLPLLITTSHHNIAGKTGGHTPPNTPNDGSVNPSYDYSAHIEFDETTSLCSELIMWRVDAIGPLGMSGGLTELAKISSPNIAAFDNVAWLPTLLPSSVLGSSHCSSPSSLFVASDGVNLRLYQAVIDARGLLTDHHKHNKGSKTFNVHSSGSSLEEGLTNDNQQQYHGYNIVSEQSTSRPGCIIELDVLKSAQHDWTSTQLLHVFQGQLITGQQDERQNDGAFIDLRNLDSFTETFFLVVLERGIEGISYLHMWEIVISSTQACEEAGDDMKEGAGSDTSSEPQYDNQSGPQLKVETNKVHGHRLFLPDGVQVLYASAAAGHLSSSTIYPACLAPYLFATACSDGFTRYWCCNPNVENKTYHWAEWQMMGLETSAINIPGRPISLSFAFTGRVAIAYRLGGVILGKDNPKNKYINLYVAIYECESTGGSEWVQEDLIELKNIYIPDPKAEIDLSCILGERKISHVLSSENFFKMQLGSHGNHHGSHHGTHATTPHTISPSSSMASLTKIPHVPSIPSLSTIQSRRISREERVNFSVKKCIAQTGNKTGILQQKHLVQLDWAPTEDGGHLLTVAVGSKILIYGPVNADIADTVKQVSSTSAQHPYEAQTTQGTQRPVLQKSLSLSVNPNAPIVRWMKLRTIELNTADGLPPLPMHVSWAKDGVLIVGMDNEMHVYSQWHDTHECNDIAKLPVTATPSSESFKVPVRRDPPLLTNRMSTLKISQSVPHLHKLLSAKISEKREKRDSMKKTNTLSKKEPEVPIASILKECGLFEACQITNPVLPQYHPKQLLELLNFGKVRRVKAILAHLMHCVTDGQIQEEEEPTFRPRAMSVHQVAQSEGKVQVSEEMTSFVEISSIPPLPLHCLLAVDTDTSYANTAAAQSVTSPTHELSVPSRSGGDYNDLFTPYRGKSGDDELDLNLSDDSEQEEVPSELTSKTAPSATKSRFAFGTKECEVLSSALIHVRLPGLNNLDQMYLMALADTVAHTHTDFSDKFQTRNNKLVTSELDDCGLRFIVAVGHHTYLMKSLPLAQRAFFQKTGLPFSDMIWAFHSESEQEILDNLIANMCRNEPAWKDLQLLGVGWFIRNINTLRTLLEKIAKSTFVKTKEPLDSAIFYLAMKKKPVIWGLFRSVGDARMTEFFKHDFTQERWRKAALKNAYALLGLQRFQHAAAFFLLAGSVKDAIDICVTRLNDLQLAIVITRLYEAELSESDYPQTVIELLDEHVLGGAEHDEDMYHPDPFLRSMAYWICKKYKKALSTLLVRNIGISHPLYKDYNERDTISVFNFYNYLRTHPLLIRQKIAAQADQSKTNVVLAGFTSLQQEVTSNQVQAAVTINSKLTPTERRLYFHTAHTHMKSGCPSLALEVLTKLPKMADLSATPEDEDEESSNEQGKTITEPTTHTSAPGLNKTGATDWGAPVSQPSTAPAVLDWGATLADPFSVSRKKLYHDDEPDFALSSDSDSESSADEGLVMKKIGQEDGSDAEKADRAWTSLPPVLTHPPAAARTSSQPEHPKDDSKTMVFDIVAQQLKFIACLKIAMEELATLATGFEVDGGHLRYQLYIWLENQIDVLKTLCNYRDSYDEVDTIEPASDTDISRRRLTLTSVSDTVASETDGPHTPTAGRANLHEVLLADRMDFEVKLTRMARRKQWLKRNQQLLRTLLTYCSLYGASGGGLACIKMELILLLQELQQEKQQKMLLSPLPFPTTLPLLSASVASSKTVIVDPITHLQNTIREMLASVITITRMPDYTGNLHQVITVRNLSTALSSCIYECLCDSESLTISKLEKQDVGLEGFTHISTSVVYKDSCLMAGASKKKTIPNMPHEMPNSSPAKWPGVTQLISMLMRERDGDAPKLSLLLCESLFAVYSSLLIHALTFYETNVLYRLASNSFNERMWGMLFGGGVKDVVKQRTTSITESMPTISRPADSMNKQRQKLALKVTMASGGSPVPTRPDVKPSYNERYIPPRMSMVNHLLTKPSSTEVPVGVDYDSEDDDIIPAKDQSEYSDDETDEPDADSAENSEHIDPQSYSWLLIRLAIMKHTLHNMQQFLSVIGYDIADLPGSSPLLHALIKNLEGWVNQVTQQLRYMKYPSDYIDGLYVDKKAPPPLINKYKTMLKPQNTPFKSNQHAALPCKRLWVYLVHQEHLQDLFIKYLFKKQKKDAHQDTLDHGQLKGHTSGKNASQSDVKLLHTDSEIISAFAINTTNENQISLATHREILELDATLVLSPPHWLDAADGDSDSDNEFLQPGSNRSSGFGSDFVYVPDKKHTTDHPAMGYASTMSQTGTGTSLIGKHAVQDVKKMAAHPVFPRYLVGSSDGAVRIFEYGHREPLHEARAPGLAPRATRLQYSAQGNKFGLTDVEGYLSLYLVGLSGTNTSRAFLNMKCHSKTASDFAFISSSSFLATSGHSSDNSNVCLWDTLLPIQSCLISSFKCHDHGSTALLYAPQHQLLVSGGKKGDVCIFDVRQRKQLHTFTVHEGSSVRCMALDPCEEFFVTGSADGDIKVWGLSQHQLLRTYTGEHSKTSLFSRMNAGVLQLHVNNNGELFSSGADGTLKMRTISSEPTLYDVTPSRVTFSLT